MKDHPDDFLSKVVCLLGCSRTSLDAQSVTANDGERRIREAQVRHVVREVPLSPGFLARYFAQRLAPDQTLLAATEQIGIVKP